MSRSERSLLLLISIACCALGLICLATADSSRGYNPLARPVAEAIERLYNQVLHSTIEDARQRLPHLNDSEAIDKQYFDDLDSTLGNEDYYSTAYYIFAWINSQLMAQQRPDKLLLEVLPGEKAAIRNFFHKVRPPLEKYLQRSHQSRPELIANVTRWAGQQQDSVVMSYIEFPRSLQAQIPELQLMDYTKLAKALIEGVATGIWGSL
ncbi:uncharacterized protein LOC108163411 [Drosophila miranda]|uniref:Uncharacterized protein Hf n=1 Tax=Drosophila pseudoobscura pseudoobscura TaxID=46245 RepID=Q29KK0_DROPS|nr:uncharacterized protein LOC4816766 [Drosophila pseudoobscura]XP_017154166.1 uncharacterized protein LOC108163411 [Drosophila miranda]